MSVRSGFGAVEAVYQDFAGHDEVDDSSDEADDGFTVADKRVD